MMDDYKTKPRRVEPVHVRMIRRAFEVATGSKHPRSQHGAVIVNPDLDNWDMATGYNGTPYGFPEDELDWAPGMTWTSRDWTIHAEENAIGKFGYLAYRGCDIYVTAMPCPRCYLRIAQCRMGRIIVGGGEYSKMGDDLDLIKRFQRIHRIPILRVDEGGHLNYVEL